MTKEEAIELGCNAQSVLLNTAFAEAVGDVRNNIANQFFHSKPDEQHNREHLYRLLLALDAVVGQLEAYVLTKDQLVAPATGLPSENTYDD